MAKYTREQRQRAVELYVKYECCAADVIRELELKILKNRSAALGQPIPLRYYPAFSCFEEG